ncbi:cytochrome c biogenesis protein CcdA [Phormidium sp. CLA17]|uniref:cytochrome c biogenesis CcdA family protein n=1 Tax=Leptolyngbya sp. Cla-17 TaxID=2803751 RepID=UPI0014929EA4|nr:cytochrome c biogenesis CcdA family protein [Leptolyngbya sp. Cla-17]MBM0742723.1 cytochrome c biogenesis protein CcdA [Leptolyngbya sp. Cla-17]
MARVKLSKLPNRSISHSKHPLLLITLFVSAIALTLLLEGLLQSSVYQSLQQFALWTGDRYEQWFTQHQYQTNNSLALIGLAFLGGLVASISPCILSLLPVNLSYIGTREIVSRRDAFFKAGSFVFGVITVLSFLGLFSLAASLILIQFRGYIQVAVGTLIVLMGLNLIGSVQIPHLRLKRFASRKATGCNTLLFREKMSRRSRLQSLIASFLTGPYGIGITFALVSSPCTSPIMISVLTAASATGSQWQSTLTMISYAFGYTAIIFLASLFTGLAKQTRTLLLHSNTIIQLANVALLVVGMFYVINGSQWIIATWA